MFIVDLAFDTLLDVASLSDGASGTTHKDLADWLLMRQNVVKQNITIRMTTALSYDRLNGLMGINSIPAGANELPLSFQYSYNDANQRVRVGLHDGSYWIYEYDALAQVKSGKRYWADGTPVAGQQYEYAYDDIGNRTETKAGGDNTGGNLRTAEYGADSLNQYTNRTVPGYVDVLGVATSGSAVTVNGTGAYRRGEYFHVALAVDNSSAAQYPSIVIQAVAGVNSASSTGSVFLAKTPEVFVHDNDGNLTQDGHWTYTWDGENRLVAMEAQSAVPAAAKLRVEFEYDWRGRRIGKAVKAWSGTSYTNVYGLKFLYDGWNLVAELDANNNLVRSYLWGTDLSGSYQGAGGVGGLLAVNVATNGVHFPAYDGNGNIAGLVSASSGTTTARFEYGPFAEPIRVSGQVAKAMPLRFSTKYLDEETGLYYYGYRYYDPSTGRWVNSDPVGTRGGINTHAFSGNALVGQVDPLGLQMYGCCGDCGPDVTEALHATLEAVKKAFSLAEQELKEAACAHLFLQNGWDILELAYSTSDPSKKEQFNKRAGHEDKLEHGTGGSGGGCTDTVVINGKCVEATQASYILGGLITKLCNPFGSLVPASKVKTIAHWRIRKHKTDPPPAGWGEEPNTFYEHQAFSLFDFGFDGTGAPADDLNHICTVKEKHKKTHFNQFTPVWEPLFPRPKFSPSP